LQSAGSDSQANLANLQARGGGEDLKGRILIVLVFELILFKCILCCIHGVFIITVLIIADIWRSYFDKGRGRETGIIVTVIIVVILFFNGKAIGPGVIVPS
jgi:hypothetical protein